jgi:hypothetical protein
MRSNPNARDAPTAACAHNATNEICRFVPGTFEFQPIRYSYATATAITVAANSPGDSIRRPGPLDRYHRYAKPATIANITAARPQANQSSVSRHQWSSVIGTNRFRVP